MQKFHWQLCTARYSTNLMQADKPHLYLNDWLIITDVVFAKVFFFFFFKNTEPSSAPSHQHPTAKAHKSHQLEQQVKRRNQNTAPIVCFQRGAKYCKEMKTIWFGWLIIGKLLITPKRGISNHISVSFVSTEFSSSAGTEPELSC